MGSTETTTKPTTTEKQRNAPVPKRGAGDPWHCTQGPALEPMSVSGCSAPSAACRACNVCATTVVSGFLILAMFEAYFISSKCCLLLTFLLKRVGGFLCSQCLKRCFERKTTSSLLYTLHVVLLSTFPLTLKDFFVLHVSCCLFLTFPLKASDCSGLLTTTEGPLLPLLWLSTNIG